MKHVLSWRWGDVRIEMACPSKLVAELMGSCLVERAAPAEVEIARVPRKAKKKRGGARKNAGRKLGPTAISADGPFVQRRARAFNFERTGESFLEDDVIVSSGGRRIAEILVHEEASGWGSFVEPGQEIEPIVCANPYWEE